MLQASPKPVACKHCRQPFTPFTTLKAKACSVPCALALVEAKKAREAEKVRKVERAATKAAKERIKTRRQWLDEAQQVVNKYVRLRDRNLGCVSCDLPATWGGQWHASHFRSVGAASAVRFNLWNLHKACSVCNNWRSGNLSEYEPRLRLKIGDERVDWLRSQNEVVRYSIAYLKRLKAVFGRRTKRLERALVLG